MSADMKVIIPMLRCLSFQYIIFTLFVIVNNYLYANDIIPRPYEKAKIGQWILLRNDESTIKSVIVDIGFANEELVYIIFRNDTDDLSNNEKSVSEYILLWGDDVFQYVPQIYWPPEIQLKIMTKISGYINDKPATKWTIGIQYKGESEPHHVLYPEIMGGAVIELYDSRHYKDFYDIAKIGPMEILDFGDDYNLDEYPIPPINGIEMDDVFLIEPRIGQWVETTYYGEFSHDHKFITEKRRASIIDIENTDDGEMVVVEEAVMIDKNSIFNSKIKKYSLEHILKRNAGYKKYLQLNGLRIESFEGDIGGRVFKGYRIFDQSMPDYEIIMSKDIPITGVVRKKGWIETSFTTDFSRPENEKVNDK